MFTKYKTKQTIFLDPKSKVGTINTEGVDIILSPSLYWVKRFTLPVKELKEAKKLLPSLFEEFLPEDQTYSYDGYFSDSGFIAFAYDNKQIAELLAAQGIDKSKIDKIYFAQTIFTEEMLPYQIDNDRVLHLQDGVVIVVPKEIAPQAKSVKLDTIELRGLEVRFEHFNTVIDPKLLKKASIFLVIFGSIGLLQWYGIEKNIATVEEQRSKLFAQYHLLPTMVQNRSLLKKYEKIDTQQKHIHQIFATLLRSLPQGVYLEEIKIAKGSAFLRFSGVADKKSLLDKLHTLHIKSEQYNDKNLQLEVQL